MKHDRNWKYAKNRLRHHFFIAALNVLLEFLTVGLPIDLLKKPGIGSPEIVFGLAFPVLGICVRSKFAVVLIIAIAGFILDGILGFVLAASERFAANVSGTGVRFFLLLPLIQGIGAIRKIGAEIAQVLFIGEKDEESNLSTSAVCPFPPPVLIGCLDPAREQLCIASHDTLVVDREAGRRSLADIRTCDVCRSSVLDSAPTAASARRDRGLHRVYSRGGRLCAGKHAFLVPLPGQLASAAPEWLAAFPSLRPHRPAYFAGYPRWVARLAKKP